MSNGNSLVFKVGEIARVANTSYCGYRGELVEVTNEGEFAPDTEGAPAILLNTTFKREKFNYVFLTKLSPLELLAACAEESVDSSGIQET